MRESRVNRRGLSAGTPAPAFSLPDTDGKTRRLDEFHGRKVVLVFSDPHCPPCDEVAPHLAAFAESPARAADVVMISRGDAHEVRRKARAHGFTFPVLLQKGWQVSKRYALLAAPVAYLLDEDGTIATEPAVGSGAISRLLRETRR